MYTVYTIQYTGVRGNLVEVALYRVYTVYTIQYTGVWGNLVELALYRVYTVYTIQYTLYRCVGESGRVGSVQSVHSRVSQFRFKKCFASKRNLAKQKRFRFVSLQFRETTNQKFRFVSLRFAS